MRYKLLTRSAMVLGVLSTVCITPSTAYSLSAETYVKAAKLGLGCPIQFAENFLSVVFDPADWLASAVGAYQLATIVESNLTNDSSGKAMNAFKTSARAYDTANREHNVALIRACNLAYAQLKASNLKEDQPGLTDYEIKEMAGVYQVEQVVRRVSSGGLAALAE